MITITKRVLFVFITTSFMLRADYRSAHRARLSMVDFDTSNNVERMVFGAYGQQDRDNYACMKRLWERNNPTVIEPVATCLIPKICFHIWLGARMSARYEQFVQSWLEKHPGWHHIFCVDNQENYGMDGAALYSFEQLEMLLADKAQQGKLIALDIRFLPLTTRSMLEKATNYAQKSDILRYEMLYRYGGVYADTDMLCLKPLDMLHHCYTFYIGLANTSTVEIGNSILASCPGHPILKRMLDVLEIPEATRSMDDILNSTGPRFVTKIMMEFLRYDIQRVVVFPCSYFFPTPQWARVCSQDDMDSFIGPESFTNHYWKCSWWKGMSVQ